MTSLLVLGGATYGMKTQAVVNRLIGTALDLGITRIDTANGRELIINSKIGLPNPSEFTPEGIRQSVEKSLRRLRIDRLGTLFVHSLNSDYLTQKNIEAMELLREQGKITKIGYAGDGSNLSAAINIPSFDDFMATFSIIDQSTLTIFGWTHRLATCISNWQWDKQFGQACNGKGVSKVLKHFVHFSSNP